MQLETSQEKFGIDLGDQSLRLVQLRKKGKKFILHAHNEVTIPDEIIINGEIKQEEKLIELIKELLKSAKGKKIKSKHVISVLPETKTFIKVIEVTTPEDADTEGLAKTIKEEAVNHIPLDLDEAYLDWQILEKKSESAKVLIGVVPKIISDSYFSVLDKSGLTPQVLEIEAASIIRGLISEGEEKAKIIIDFGAIRTGLVLYDQKTVQFTVSLPISGKKITETIAKTLTLDEKKAEKAKIVCGLDPKKCEGALRKVLYKAIDDLSAEIKKSIDFYKTKSPKGSPVSEIVLCGGGANFLEIDKVLSEKLKIPVKIGNPAADVFEIKNNTIDKNKITSYTTAIGLALRGSQRNI